METQSRTLVRQNGSAYEFRVLEAGSGMPEPWRLEILTGEGSSIVSVPLTARLRLDQLDDCDLEQMLRELLGEVDQLDADGSESGFGELEGG